MSHALMLRCCLRYICAGHEEERCKLGRDPRAGQWKSPAFLKYIDEQELEADVALAVATYSEPEEWID